MLCLPGRQRDLHWQVELLFLRHRAFDFDLIGWWGSEKVSRRGGKLSRWRQGFFDGARRRGLQGPWEFGECRRRERRLRCRWMVAEDGLGRWAYCRRFEWHKGWDSLEEVDRLRCEWMRRWFLMESIEWWGGMWRGSDGELVFRRGRSPGEDGDLDFDLFLLHL